MSRKTKAELQLESKMSEEERHKNFLATREERFFKLMAKICSNSDIFELPRLNVELWDQKNFTLRLRKSCGWIHLVYGYETDEFFKFDQNEDNFAYLEDAVNKIVDTIRFAESEAIRREEMKQNALSKLTKEEQELLGLK